jgi:hypothetical protein
VIFPGGDPHDVVPFDTVSSTHGVPLETVASTGWFRPTPVLPTEWFRSTRLPSAWSAVETVFYTNVFPVDTRPSRSVPVRPRRLNGVVA